MKVKDMKNLERPREKMMFFGPKYLSDKELVAIILKSGTREKDVMMLSEDEIDENLRRGSGISGGKKRIADFFNETHTLSEQAEFLKNEYGIGGRTHEDSRVRLCKGKCNRRGYRVGTSCDGD